jgi:hypothetical protein
LPSVTASIHHRTPVEDGKFSNMCDGQSQQVGIRTTKSKVLARGAKRLNVFPAQLATELTNLKKHVLPSACVLVFADRTTEIVHGHQNDGNPTSPAECFEFLNNCPAFVRSIRTMASSPSFSRKRPNRRALLP